MGYALAAIYLIAPLRHALPYISGKYHTAKSTHIPVNWRYAARVSGDTAASTCSWLVWWRACKRALATARELQNQWQVCCISIISAIIRKALARGDSAAGKTTVWLKPRACTANI